MGAYVFSIVRLHPTNLFGLTGDDAIYLSSAKALAEGKGYVLPSLPGSPPATKYPIFYPRLLSFVWLLNPVFPANLPLAISVSVVFGVGFLLLAFAIFSSLGGISTGEALVLTAYCALHPLLQFFGASVLSDMPFGFFALASMLVAQRATRNSGGQFESVECGILAGIAVLVRILGFPILLGILCTAVVRRSWRQLTVIALSAAPFVSVVAWRAVFSTKSIPPVAGSDEVSLGWHRAWTFYTDYAGIWNLGVPSPRVFWAMLQNNIGMILRAPADLLIGPTLVRDTMVGRAVVLAIAVVTVAGILRQAIQHGWKPIHLGFLFYAPIVLVWNYPDANRFFLPFWPLLIAGAWTEGKRVFILASSTIARDRRISERCLGAAVGLTVLFFGAGVIENSVRGMRSVIAQTSFERSVLIRDKRECYDWIRRNTNSDDRLIAYEDATTYLYTGRQTVQPIIFTTDEFYEPERLNQANSHFLDVAEAIRARYWLFSADDFDRDWPAARSLAESHMRQLKSQLPVVFQGRDDVAAVRLAEGLKSGPNQIGSLCEPPARDRRPELVFRDLDVSMPVSRLKRSHQIRPVYLVGCSQRVTVPTAGLCQGL